MALLKITSPHTQRAGRRTSWVMQMVMLATLPALLVQTWLFGWGTLIHVIIACLTALVSEALVLKLRQRSLNFFLRDYSAVLTGLLLALAIPPIVPWWITVTGVSFAVIVAKQLYGGLGNNPFNPAMVGYALLLVSFPVPMTQWLGPHELTAANALLSFSDTLEYIFTGVLNSAATIDAYTIDAYTMATPLDAFKHKGGLMNSEAFAAIPALQTANINAAFWVNMAYLTGGLGLLYLRIITWHTPIAMLAALSIMAGFFYIIDSSNAAGVWFHLTTGAAMFGAFLIATDPVSSCTSNRGKLYYGAGIGILIYIIRTWGGYPDGVAFAVLLMNFTAPFIDYYAQPRTYGHTQPNKGSKKGEEK